MNMADIMTCPVCGQGDAQRHIKHEEFTYKGHKKFVDNFPVFICHKCGEEFVTAEDSKLFDKELTVFQRKIDGLLTPDEIRSIRESLGYNQTEFARVLKVGEKNFARYETGISPQSRYLDWLMRIFKDYPETIKTTILGEQTSQNHNSQSRYPENETADSLTLQEDSP